MKTILLAGMIAAIAACASMPTSYQQNMDLACASITGANHALTVMVNANQLNSEQQAEVLAALDITDPVCGVSPKPPLSVLQQQAFDAAIVKLRDRLNL